MHKIGKVSRLVRYLRLGLHLAQGVATIALIYPWVGEPLRLHLKQRWSRHLLTVLGIRVDGEVPSDAVGCLIVANHVSWLDVFALNALRPAAFVAKSEVRAWPLIGWLAATNDTLFIRRGRCQDAGEAAGIMAEKLQQGRDVAIFPEGTTTDGTQVLEFRSALLQAAVDARRPVLPVAIAYVDEHGRRAVQAAYAGVTTMAQSLAAIIASRSLTVRVQPLALIDAPTASRRELAQAARGAIARALNAPVPELGERSVRLPVRLVPAEG